MSLNKVMLIGNVGNDPEIRALPNGGNVANFRVATSESWKDKSGDRQERTEWHSVAFFGPVVDGVITPYVKKGGQVYIEGQIRTRSYEDGEGVTRYVTEIIGSQINLLGGRRNGDESGNAPTPAAGKPAGSKPAAGGKGPAKGAPSSFDDFEDDIPL